MKILTTTLLIGGFMVMAVPALAATYQYVDTSGSLRTMTADNSAQALATAPNIAVHSGVMLVTGSPIVTNTTTTYTGTTYTGTVSGDNEAYGYINTSGNFVTVVAKSPAEAMLASDKATHSGVILVAR